MASAQMPEEFFEIVSHHLPPERPVGPKGGRPRVGHRIVMRVIWFVLTTGARWEDVPPELGCSGRTAHRRLRAWEEAGIWDRLYADLLRLLKGADKLDPDTAIIDSVTVRAFGGGEATGLNPVDRSRKGTKHTLLVDRHGVPLAIRTAGANASDHRQIIPRILDFPRVGGQPGRPKEWPDEAYADRGFDSEGSGELLGGWGSSRTSPSGARRMGAGWGRSAGWWSGRSVG
jgi:transposase